MGDPRASEDRPDRLPEPHRLTGDARRILAVQALRAFACGLGSIVIGVTLARRGLSGFEVGLVLAALLAGVPTRQAYVVGVVDPDERTAAAAYTNTARYVTRPLGPLVAAPILQVSLGAPFVIAGVLKSAYDLSLYVLFKRTPPRGSASDVR